MNRFRPLCVSTAVVLCLLGCSKKQPDKAPDNPSAQQEQQDATRLKKGEDLVMETFNARFTKSGDDFYTAVIDREDERNPKTYYFQLKAPKVKATPGTLSEADRLNQMTWSAHYTLTFPAYRETPLYGPSVNPAWGEWKQAFDRDGITFHVVEKDGELRVDSNFMELSIYHYDFASAVKAGDIPASLR